MAYKVIVHLIGGVTVIVFGTVAFVVIVLALLVWIGRIVQQMWRRLAAVVLTALDGVVLQNRGFGWRDAQD